MRRFVRWLWSDRLWGDYLLFIFLAFALYVTVSDVASHRWLWVIIFQVPLLSFLVGLIVLYQVRKRRARRRIKPSN